MTPASVVALFAIAVLFSALLTALARRYALRRQLLDMPGQRRSHALAMPRGGGIGPVLTMLIGGALLSSMHPAQARALGGCLTGLVAVAAIGWLDDHRALSAWLRLVVHVVAASVAALALLGIPASLEQAALLALAVFWIVSLINAWNFMDGIDGLASTQAVLAAACMFAGGLLYAWLDPTWIAFAWVCVAALLGFLPFNFPRAKIFLGDVGSGALGFVIACLLLRAITGDASIHEGNGSHGINSPGVGSRMPWPLALLPVSAFLIDTGLTLLKRVAQGRAWWQPHREHLYQWLVRRRITHANVTLLYALWTFATCLAALAAGGLDTRQSACVSLAALLSATVLWGWARRCLWSNARKSNARVELR